MAVSAWFWLIFVICVIFGGAGWLGPEPYRRHAFGLGGLVLLFLLGLLAYQVFGNPVLR